MSDLAIRVENLGKRYRIGRRQTQYPTLRDSLSAMVAAQWRRLIRIGKRGEARQSENIWALRNVDLGVEVGEVLGIIGRNGAGKTTLLKVLSRITEPTIGRVEIRGRVGSLLEVGTGFHPELTGRENVYLNGTILGMRRSEIDDRFDEIVAFAEIDKFLDTPVKRYSSGMYVRLAFAVAAHMNPEILMVDEVLAVGDLAFQKRCLGKMGEVARGGRTVLLVTHNMLAVQALCTRALWLDQGEVKGSGPAGEIVDRYLRSASTVGSDRVWDTPESAPGTDKFRVRRIAVRTEGDGEPQVDRKLDFVVEFWNLSPGARLTITLHVLSIEDVVAFSTSTLHSETTWDGKPHPEGLFRSVCSVPPRLLNANAYKLRLIAVEDQARAVFRLDDALFFSVSDVAQGRGAYFGERPGIVAPRLPWTTSRVEESRA